MKNRRSSGGGVLRRNLIGHIDGCPNKNLPAEEVVKYLQSAFKQYERTKVRELTRQVQSILEETKSKKLVDDVDAASGSSGLTASDKKRHSEDDDADSIFEEVDLMKSLTRDSYRRCSAKRKRAREDDEVVELEVVTSGNHKVDLVKAKDLDSRGGGRSEERAGDIVSGGPMFKDLGGMNGVVEELTRKVIRPLLYPKLARHLGCHPTTGILLHGPPGCGKTSLARAIARETGLPFYMTAATELVSGISGASEENIRELFSKAFSTAPSIIFIDEIDAIASKRENQQRGMENRIVMELMSCMEKSSRLAVEDSQPAYVLAIGATNRLDAVDPALRRQGRFDREIFLGVPDESARVQILSVLTQNLKVEGNIDLLKIARETPGFVGADLAALTNEAANTALNRIIDLREAEISRNNGGENQALDLLPEEVEMASITMAEFEAAVRSVQPSTRREGFSEIPDVKWDDIGGMRQLRQEFERHIIRRIKFPERYEKRGGKLERGFLLYGPPGCGKTLIAMAVANEAGANFIHIKGAELLNKYVGESELAVRTLFSRARTCSPCIIFFDEVDALTKKCGSEESVVERVLKMLMLELAGGGPRKDVYVIGATNRPEVIDGAVLRPGRFGKHMYVPLPSGEERGLILKTLARDKPIDAGVDLMAIGKDLCEKFSGADLYNLMNEVDEAALDDDPSGPIKDEHFMQVLEKVSPSVPDEEIQRYDHLSKTHFRAV